MMSSVRYEITGIALLAVAGMLFLAFGVFGVHTLFIDDKVDEAGPVFDSGVAAVAAPVEPAPTGEPIPCADFEPDRK